MTQEAGRVEQIWIYPVKSLGGAAVPRVRIEAAGLAGDRAYAVVHAESGAVLRGKDVPALAGVAATGDAADDEAAVSAVVPVPVRLEPLSGNRPAGAAAVHLVSRQAIARAAAGDVPAGCSADDPRANLLLALPAGGDERSWVGRRLRVGSAVLEVTRRPKHCLGVYAEVVQRGEVAVGDPVLLEDASPV